MVWLIALCGNINCGGALVTDKRGLFLWGYLGTHSGCYHHPYFECFPMRNTTGTLKRYILLYACFSMTFSRLLMLNKSYQLGEKNKDELLVSRLLSIRTFTNAGLNLESILLFSSLGSSILL